MVAPQAPVRSARLDGIDALRALAIFYVLMNHVNMRLLFAHVPYLKPLPPQLATSLVWQGQAGVQIFFAVSGFLITSTSIQRWGKPANIRIRDFYRLRFARIAPLLLTLLALLSLLHLLDLPDFVISRKVGGLKAALIAAFTLRVGLLEATRGYLPASWDILWSLSVEEAFYLGFPLACRFLRGGKRLVVLLSIFVVLGPFGRTILTHGNETWQEYSYLGGMDAIALGCLTTLFLMHRQLTSRTVHVFTATGSVLLVFCLGLSKMVNRLGLDASGLGMTVLALGTCMLIAASAQTSARAPRLLAPLLALGRFSYEVYLTHMFVVFACFHAFMKLGHRIRLVPVLFVTIVFFAGLVGYLVSRLFTEPANRRLRRAFGGFATLAASIPPKPAKVYP